MFFSRLFRSIASESIIGRSGKSSLLAISITCFSGSDGPPVTRNSRPPYRIISPDHRLAHRQSRRDVTGCRPAAVLAGRKSDAHGLKRAGSSVTAAGFGCSDGTSGNRGGSRRCPAPTQWAGGPALQQHSWLSCTAWPPPSAFVLHHVMDRHDDGRTTACAVEFTRHRVYVPSRRR